MDSLADWVTSRLAVEIFTGVVVQATIILGIAWLATTLLRRASAALRHGVWSLALAGLLALPVLSVFLPSWNVGLPEGLQFLLIEHPAGQAPSDTAPGLLPAEERPLRMDAQQQPVVVEFSEEVRLDAPGVTPPDAGRAVAPVSAMPTGLPGRVWILLIWGVGVLMLLGRLLLHAMRLWVLARHAELLADARRVAEVARLARGLGIRRRVRVLCSPNASMAMTWGLWRPVVMLPYQARLWSDERRRVVLLHELAHIKRWDYLIHLVTQCARACYWFNPLVWVAARRIHVEQERACDDRVLQAGAGACDYAAHLLDIARVFLKRPAPLPGGIAMVRGSTLKERVWAILNARANRHALSLKTGLAAACMGVCLILPVATLQLCAPALDPGAAPSVASALEPGSMLPPPTGLLADDPAAWHKAALAPEVDTAALVALLRHEDTFLRGRAAWALGERKARQAVAPLLAGLADDDPLVRLQVVHALGKIEDRRALDRLDAMLHDDCPDVRAAAVRAMEKICRCHALESLPVALIDRNPRVRMTAAHVLGETIRGLRADDSPGAHRALRDHLRPAIDALVEALRDDSQIVRQRVAYALGEARDEAAIEALKAAFHDAAAPVRLEAVRAIGKIGASCAAPALRLALNDQDPDVRAMAASVLDQLQAS